VVGNFNNKSIRNRTFFLVGKGKKAITQMGSRLTRNSPEAIANPSL
jgi:hypothetical protein